MTCVCGSQLRKIDIARHKRTSKHKEYEANNKIDDPLYKKYIEILKEWNEM